jgi:hypothetical protein
MQVPSLIMVEGVRPARSGSVIPRRLIGKTRKGKAVGIEKRGSKAPWFVAAAGSRVCILEFFVIAKIPRKRNALAILST